MKQPGELFIVATPIGNLKDITLRALEVLATVSLIAAEDTRHSALLLAHYSIKTPLVALHEHNEYVQSRKLLAKFRKGESIAVISDAGTPLISDPGFMLSKLAHGAGIKVVPIPGASAAITALCASGLPTDQFHFVGFLPVKAAAVRNKLLQLKNESATLIFYEAPHRICATVRLCSEIFAGDREAVIARELTKKFETISCGTLAELQQQLENGTLPQQGEIVLLIKGKKQGVVRNTTLIEKVLTILSANLPAKKAVELTAAITGEKKNSLYRQLMVQKPNFDEENINEYT